LVSPNTLIFVDLTSDDPDAAARFYVEVMGWEDDPRGREGLFHRLIPGGFFPNRDGSPSEVGNLHIGIHKAANARPHPDKTGADPRYVSPGGRKARVWVLVGEGQSEADILDKAAKRGARILWRNHYWAEFNGYNSAFADPWGNEIILWTRAGPQPNVPATFTRE
jgi:predicted enzyme related to lactoylglutathione lyase